MDHTQAEISKHVRIYVGVFIALAIATVVTVAANQLDVGHAVAISIALLIATVKASLVAAVFMHLKWEKSFWIWGPLAFCFFFLLTLLFIPVITANEHLPQAHTGTWDVPLVRADSHAAHSNGH